MASARALCPGGPAAVGCSHILPLLSQQDFWVCCLDTSTCASCGLWRLVEGQGRSVVPLEPVELSYLVREGLSEQVCDRQLLWTALRGWCACGWTGTGQVALTGSQPRLPVAWRPRPTSTGDSEFVARGATWLSLHEDGKRRATRLP